MILDCCYAFQSVRDRDSRTFELLAACGIRETTPQAGDWSFTTAMIDAMEDILRVTHVISISDLYDRLLKLNSPLASTPLRKLLKGDESIELVPIRNGRESDITAVSSPLTVLSMTISLSRRIDENLLKKLGRWMRTYLPKDVQAIAVQNILSKTDAIQAFLQQSSNANLKGEIVRELKSHSHPDSLILETTPLNPKDNSDETRLVRTILQDLQNWNDCVYQSLQSNLLLNSHFYSEKELYDLTLSIPARALGLADAARIRLLNLTLDDDSDLESIKPLSYNTVQHEPMAGVRSTATHTYGTIAKSLVLIEKRPYNTNLPRAKVLRNVKETCKIAQSRPWFFVPYRGF
jgi:hypothetical protein